MLRMYHCDTLSTVLSHFSRIQHIEYAQNIEQEKEKEEEATNNQAQLILTPPMVIEQLKYNYGRFSFFRFFQELFSFIWLN